MCNGDQYVPLCGGGGESDLLVVATDMMSVNGHTLGSLEKDTSFLFHRLAFHGRVSCVPYKYKYTINALPVNSLFLIFSKSLCSNNLRAEGRARRPKSLQCKDLEREQHITRRE